MIGPALCFWGLGRFKAQGRALRLWLGGAALGLTTQAMAQAPLPQEALTALSQAGIPLESVAIWVKAVDAPATAPADFSLNPSLPLNPASVMKLVTAYAALEHLGAAYTWDTDVLIDGTLVDRTLHGDLIVRGTADPLMSFQRWWSLLRRIRAHGIEHVQGDIVLDPSILPLPPHDPGRFDGKPLRPYNSGASGLLVHFNTQNLHLTPSARAGDPVQVVPEQPLKGVRIVNNIRTAGGACGTWYAQLTAALETGPAEQDLQLHLGGQLPASCGPRQWAAAPLSPNGFASALTHSLWHELGGTLSGTVRTAPASASARVWLTDTSPSLSEAVREMNKWSSNVIARQLLAVLGISDATAKLVRAAPGQSPVTDDAVQAGAHLTEQRLRAAGMDTTGLVIENGSGLSRRERIRADTLGTMLQSVWQRPYMPDFMASLPVAGVDGTARSWLTHSPARGQIHIKTGSVNNVRAIAGYVLDRNHRRHVVVMMVNHPQAAASRAAQNALLEWVWSGASRSPEH